MRTLALITVPATLALLACASGSASSDVTDEGALQSGTTKTFSCAPIDADEACAESGGANDFCVTKLSIVATGSTKGVLKINREAPDGSALAAQQFDEAVTFGLKRKTLQGAWSDGDVNLSLTKIGPGDRYEGTAAMPDVGSFGVECNLEGAAHLPLYVKTVRPNEECNGKNAEGQVLRCLKGATCRDEEGREIAVLQRKKGICDPQLVHSAKRNEACNVNPPDSVAVLLCERGAGLHCKSASGEEIPLAQSSEPGTCQ